MTPQRSPLYFAFRRFTDNKAAVISGVVLLVIILMAIFAPLITPTGYEDQHYLTEALALSLSGILDQNLEDPLIRPLIAKESFAVLDRVKKLLHDRF